MPNVVIVALPSEDDYVNKISSEKVAHMTILFLGDLLNVQNLGKIIDFTQHASDQMLTRFGWEVDKRGVLGPDLADVLFFKKSRWTPFSDLNSFRSALLQENNIRTAYDSAIDKFPEWIPHLTLGYPTAPAKVDNRDYPGINYVNFDRIAVWVKEFDGIEFPLKSWDDEMVQGGVRVNESERGEAFVEDILQHHGVLGMKWGRSGARGSGGGGSKSSGGSSKPSRKVRRADKKFEKQLSTPNKVFKTQIKLHNATSKAMNEKHIPRINKKYQKAIDKGTLLNTSHPTTKAYHKEMMDSYLKELNIEANKMTNASGTKKYQVLKSDYDTLGFAVRSVDVKHASNDGSFRVNFILDDKGVITGFEIANDTLQQGETFVKDFLVHVK